MLVLELGQQHGERVGAKRRDDIARAHADAQAHGDLSTQHVRGFGAEPHLGRRKPLDPQRQHRHRRRLAFAQRDELIQVLDELALVGKPGHQIGGVGLAREPLLAFAFDGQADRARQGIDGIDGQRQHVLHALANQLCREFGAGFVGGQHDQGGLRGGLRQGGPLKQLARVDRSHSDDDGIEMIDGEPRGGGVEIVAHVKIERPERRRRCQRRQRRALSGDQQNAQCGVAHVDLGREPQEKGRASGPCVDKQRE